VRRDLHHSGYGRVLFAGLVQAAYDMGAKWITLEVRASNDNAMRMYENFGFKVIGRRKGYYTDNGEDAIVMWSDSIYSPRFRRAYEANLERIDVPVRGLRREAGPTRDG
jgi:ribosomal-protein-alanine N-acetyltransferase